MALDYDFYVNTLGFNTAVGKDRPYERATAQFRKEQLDSTATVGDQSLTGWWTRGQLSFHKGAGVDYYEVLGDEEDTVANRFKTSHGLNPWQGGQVSLVYSQSSTAASGTSAIIDLVPYRYSTWTGYLPTTSSTVFSLRSDGKVRILGGAATDIQTGVTSMAGSPDGQHAYAIKSGSIYSLYYSSTSSSLTSSQVYTVDTTTGATGFIALAWAKDRLLALDNVGGWYQMNGNVTGGIPSAVTSGDLFWSVTPNASPWTICDSPNVVYMANANLIYAASPDTDGFIPTLGAAPIAASLPLGETIYSIFHYLGYLIIATDQGVRAAAVAGDGGLTVGPLLVEGTFTCRRMAAEGDVVYVTGTETGSTDSAVYQINPTQLVTQYQPAYCRMHLLGTLTANKHGAILLLDGRLATFDSTQWTIEWNTYASGQLTTGYHRLGTLDPKAFRYLRVKVGGDGGAIDVAARMPDEAGDVPIGSLYPGETIDFDLAEVLGPYGPLEYIALRFYFNSGVSGGPTLLGYQLKALPVPKRQRMIRVPLLLADSEQNRQKQVFAHRRSGVTDPWSRLAALEALEQSNAVVTFEDNLTGETGSAYIESVEVQRTSNGDFGGFIFLTLRVV